MSWPMMCVEEGREEGVSGGRWRVGRVACEEKGRGAGLDYWTTRGWSVHLSLFSALHKNSRPDRVMPPPSQRTFRHILSCHFKIHISHPIRRSAYFLYSLLLPSYILHSRHNTTHLCIEKPTSERNQAEKIHSSLTITTRESPLMKLTSGKYTPITTMGNK